VIAYTTLLVVSSSGQAFDVYV